LGGGASVASLQTKPERGRLVGLLEDLLPALMR
jgi:hypothetical protein